MKHICSLVFAALVGMQHMLPKSKLSVFLPIRLILFFRLLLMDGFISHTWVRSYFMNPILTCWDGVFIRPLMPV